MEDTEYRLVQTVQVSNLKIKKIRINNYFINYAVCGAGRPLLLIHGANFGWGVWYANIPELSKYFTVYAIDLPGAGRSSAVDYSKLDLERDLVQILENFIWQLGFKNFSIIGCSVGGWLALKIALLHPNLIKKIILVDSVGLADYTTLSEKIIGFYPLAKFIAKTILKPTRSNPRIEKFLRNIFYNKKLTIQPEFIEYFYETMNRSHNLLFISRLTKLNRQFILQDQLHNILHPILLFWGEEDKIMPLDRNKQSFSLLPNAAVTIMPQVGHIPALENAKVFNEKAISFLRDKT